jgi:hypothetical protein
MSVASHHVRIAFAICAALMLCGCRGTIMPRFESPGTAGTQRANALQYDPYPLDDVAPPVAGGRPREYDRPIPEVTRGKLFHYPQPNEPAIVPPSFAAPVSPVVTAPPVMPGATVSPFAPPAATPYQTPPPVVTTPYQAPPAAAPYSMPPPANVPYQTPASALPPASTMVRPPY